MQQFHAKCCSNTMKQFSSIKKGVEHIKANHNKTSQSKSACLASLGFIVTFEWKTMSFLTRTMLVLSGFKHLGCSNVMQHVSRPLHDGQMH